MRYEGSKTDLVIPEKINGAKVVGIGLGAFKDSSITSVTSNSITYIGECVFNEFNAPSLTSVSFPNVTEIGSNAFDSNSRLTTVYFPNVKSIGNHSFFNCTSLTTANFPNVTSISWYAFSKCTSLKTVYFPRTTNMRHCVFWGCSGLTTVSFPNLTEIGNGSFEDCFNLTTASFPKVTNIGDDAFLSDVSLKRVFLDSKVNHVGDRAFGYEQRADGTYLLISGLTIYTPATEDNQVYVYARKNGIPIVNTLKIPTAPKTGTKLTAAVQQYTVTGTNTVAYSKSANKKSVTVPATVKISGKIYSVTQVNANAFKELKIRTITLGKNVKKIKTNAFKGSKAIKLILKTKKLTKKSVKGSLKSSKIKTVQVKVGSKKNNKKYVKTYVKIFTKKNAGKKVVVK